MARRRGRASDVRGRGKPKEPSTYYMDTETDRGFVERSHARVVQRGRHRLVTRFVILLVLAFAAWMWGPSLLRWIQYGASSTASDVKGVSRSLQDGRDRRSGADFDENAY
jgi:hypothetical protein